MMNKPLKPIPEFASEAEERAFWETHDSTDYIDWSKAQKISGKDAEALFRLRAQRGQGQMTHGLALLKKARK